MVKDLTTLFSPQSVAVVGASRSAGKVGAVVLKNVIESGFAGRIYPVNPQAETLNGRPCFKDLRSLPEVPDLVVVAVPAAASLEVLNQIGEVGTKNVVCYAAGFREIGAEGEELEKELANISQKYQLNLLGPNCFGFANNLCPINVTFGQPVNTVGNLRFLSQSGALAASLLDWCRTNEVGFNHLVTLGNKTVLSENDVLRYFQTAPAGSPAAGLSVSRPVGLYLESIAAGPEFLELIQQISRTDPVFILKPGKTEAAAAAMRSHTGALAGEDEVFQAVLGQAGGIRCQTLEDFFDFARAFSWEDLPSGPRLAVVSNAGGPAVISADAAVATGLELAVFDRRTQERLAEILPRTASLLNPVDVLGDALADRFAQALEVVLKSNQADALVVILTPQLMTQVEATAEMIGQLSEKYRKPICAAFIGGRLVAEGESVLNRCKIPSFRFPERAIAALGAMWRFKKRREEPVVSFVGGQDVGSVIIPASVQRLVKGAEAENQKTLDNFQANEVISAAGIAAPATQLVGDLESARTFALHNGWPVVLKLSSPGLLHKKHLGAVIVDIRDGPQLEVAWESLERKIGELPEEIRRRVKVQVQKDIVSGVEVIVGVKRDPSFGPVLLFGAGGSLAELIADRNLQLLPIDLGQAQKLVERSKVFRLLKGGEGEPAYALARLGDLIVRLGRLAVTLSAVEEIEVNPAIVTLNDVWAVDAKVILKQGEAEAVLGPQFRTAILVGREILAGTFHHFRFESETPLAFQPGQYLSVKVANDRINCYSIAGYVAPNRFDLLVDIKPGGPGSKFFEYLKVGDKTAFLGPFGTFTLRLDDGSNHLLFLGTGSGAAPLKSMIEAVLKERRSSLSMTFYLGLNFPEEVFLEDYFRGLSREHPNFHFDVAVFKPNEKWKGHVGFITELLRQNFPDARQCSAYLCGNRFMIADATEILLSRGCPKERIYVEKL